MKLIKLAYIAHGWHLGLYDEQLLDEVVYAWKYGPVIEKLYQDFKQYGNQQITELYSAHEGNYPLPDSKIIPFLDTIWNSYSRYNGLQLSAMTHQSGTPWDIVWNQQGGKGEIYTIIPNDLIREHYKEKINELSRRKTRQPYSIAPTSRN
jgi:uncharacterized phage-associated protein